MAHSAYPHLGESAIEKLLDALAEVRKIPLPVDPILGASTVNIGTISGGRAPNVIPDHAAAELFIRLVDDGNSTREAVARAVAGKVIARDILWIPALHMSALEGFETDVMAYTTDIPHSAERGATISVRTRIDTRRAHIPGTYSRSS